MGRRYQANPKTVNKALGDLSSDGLVVRRIGRGTFVVRKDGRSAVVPRNLAIQCLVAPGSMEIDYRAALFRGVRQMLTAKGHALESRLVEPTGETGRLPLAGWAPSTRHATDGLICYPSEPLSSGVGLPGDELVAETLRRHVPVVVLGAGGRGAKLDAIVPDYTDAGFRLCEHLYRIGCRRVVILRSEAAGPETALVVGGCRAAALRWARRIAEVALPQAGDRDRPLPDLETLLVECTALDGQEHGGWGQVIGLVCVGTRALEGVILDGPFAAHRRAGRVAITSVPEPGDVAAEAAGITSYDVAPGLMAGWATRLLIGSRPGQRPVEVIVPGTVQVRGEQFADDLRSGGDRELPGREPTWPTREAASGIII